MRRERMKSRKRTDLDVPSENEKDTGIAEEPVKGIGSRRRDEAAAVGEGPVEIVPIVARSFDSSECEAPTTDVRVALCKVKRRIEREDPAQHSSKGKNMEYKKRKKEKGNR